MFGSDRRNVRPDVPVRFALHAAAALYGVDWINDTANRGSALRWHQFGRRAPSLCFAQIALDRLRAVLTLKEGELSHTWCVIRRHRPQEVDFPAIRAMREHHDLSPLFRLGTLVRKMYFCGVPVRDRNIIAAGLDEKVC